ncbi:MAG: right-handed parallel beta-helix repeat-containing protein [Acidimicrobiales bacterium]
MAGSGELIKTSDGKWTFRVLTAKGDLVATNIDGFATKASAKATLTKLLKGSYNGPITDATTLSCGAEITKDTTLEGDLVCVSAPALIIAADNITLDLNGFKITGKGAASKGGPAILFRNVKGSTVQKGTIQRFGAGVSIEGGSKNVVQNLTVIDNVGPDEGEYGDGITISGSSGNRIQGNTVARNGPFSGISVIGASSENEIRANVVTDNNMLPGEPAAGRQDMGIRIEGPAANRNKVIGNTVTGSGAEGIVVLPTCDDREKGCVGSKPNEGNQISDNLSHRNGTSGQGSGIRLFCVANPVAAAKTTVTNNQANENRTHGIHVDAVGNAQPGPTNNKLSGNSAHGNGQFDGFEGNLTPPCGTNTWEANDFGRVNQPCAGGAPPKTG